MSNERRVRKSPLANKRSMEVCLLSLLLAQALAGCGGNGGDKNPGPTSAGPVPPPAPGPVPPPAPGPVPPPAPGPVPPYAAESLHGRFVGSVKIGDAEYFGDALLTVDGAVRLYVGGPYHSDGTVQLTRPESSAQFVGNLEVQGNRASGTGVIVAQGCAPPRDVVGLCGNNVFGEVRIAVDSDGIQGEIQVDVNDAIGTWLLDLQSWDNFYVLPARLQNVAGQYEEELAEFASDGDVIMNVDGTGRLFFQSAHSACTGNGTLAPHLDGAFNVYDVTLIIGGCNETYAYLNGEYEGLATTSASNYWAYDSSLRTWLSKRADGRSQPAALVMWGRPL